MGCTVHYLACTMQARVCTGMGQVFSFWTCEAMEDHAIENVTE